MRKQLWMKMDLYKKVENVIQEYINEHKKEVRKGKELMSKLDVVRCNAEVKATKKDWNDFWEETYYPEESKKSQQVKADGYSVHYYDYDRNDPNRANPFIETPDYTEL